jgi:ubiquinone/menaquinone biosynthesis C-methylase UbiE
MYLNNLQSQWDDLGKTHPISAMLSPELKAKIDNIDDLFASGAEQVDNLLKYVGSLGIALNGDRALDFGCGLGRLTQALAVRFREVYGVDIAPSLIDLANRYNRYTDRCKYILNDAVDLNIFEANTFDFVYSYQTLHTMKPDLSKRYLREFVRVLAPNGMVVFQLAAEPAPTAKGRMFRLLPAPMINLYRRRKYGFEVYGVKKQDVIETIKQSGATVVDIRPDVGPGNGWSSFQYCAVKSAL